MARSKTEEQKAVEAAALAVTKEGEAGTNDNELSDLVPVNPDVCQDDAVPAEGNKTVMLEDATEKDGGINDAEGECCKTLSEEPSYWYIPVELRAKLEETAIKMLDNLASYSGEYNENQLNQITAALEIYSRIRG